MMHRTYQLIDADAHVNEPPELWRDRVPARFRDRAPRVERFDEGDAWVLEGVDAPINFGLNATAGMDPLRMTAWCRWEDVRPGGYDPAARLVEMDRDQVDAELLYPTPRLSHSLIANEDADFHLALVRAYNDWLSEFASHAPDRLGGVFLVPNRGVDMALAEIERASQLPGMRGALIGCWPHGDLTLQEDDDPVWRAGGAQHPGKSTLALVDSMPSTHEGASPAMCALRCAWRICSSWSGVFDRARSAWWSRSTAAGSRTCEQADDRYGADARRGGSSRTCTEPLHRRAHVACGSLTTRAQPPRHRRRPHAVVE
jgi:hypothetical protein